MITNCSIETLEVSINVIRVGRKQMTQAVFKQLPAFNVFDSKGIIAPGDFWGKVAYTVDKNRLQNQIWLVRSFKGTLSRALYDKHDWYPLEDAELQFKNKVSRLEACLNSNCDTRSLERAKQDVKWARESLEAAKNREPHLAELAALPQLFIAV